MKCPPIGSRVWSANWSLYGGIVWRQLYKVLDTDLAGKHRARGQALWVTAWSSPSPSPLSLHAIRHGQVTSRSCRHSHKLSRTYEPHYAFPIVMDCILQVSLGRYLVPVMRLHSSNPNSKPPFLSGIIWWDEQLGCAFCRTIFGGVTMPFVNGVNAFGKNNWLLGLSILLTCCDNWLAEEEYKRCS